VKILVVFYSRTGSTRKVAEELSARCGGDLEEIRDAAPRFGLIRGWWRSIREVRRRAETSILPARLSPATYDLVVLGSPVWASSMSSPLRTWLNRHRHELKTIAAYVTQNGRGGERALAQIGDLCGTTPVATAIINARDIASDACKREVDRFVDVLAAHRAPSPKPAPPIEWYAEAHQGQLGW
jgi:hypothetical protein